MPQYRIPLCYSSVVKPAPFAYHRPATIPETIALLAELAPEDGRILAGGQSLVPIMAFRLARPAHLIDINRVAGLDRLEVADGRLRIGARIRHAEGATTLARAVLAALRPGMLCLADRQFFGHALWLAATATGTDLLWWVKHNLRLPRKRC